MNTTTTTPTTDSNFNKALKVILHNEGGYSNNPKDPGGATNKGITQTTYDFWRTAHSKPHQSVKNITNEEVSNIYYGNYWKAVGADKTISYPLALMMFDTAVNCGVGTAKRLVQQANYDVKKMSALRLQYYKSLKTWNTFGRGWSNRLAYVNKQAGIA